MNKLGRTGSVLVAVAALGMLLGGIAVASNMGFKFVPNISAGTAFNLSLPWNNNYVASNDLLNDLTGADRVSKFQSDSTLLDWGGGTGPVPGVLPFTVSKGESYIVTAAGGTPVNTAVVVGSHDPNYLYTFNANEAFSMAVPYHGTFTKSNELLNDLNTQGMGVDRVSKFQSDSTLLDWGTGTGPVFGTLPFNLDLGMGVIVTTTAGGGGTGYAYPHY